MFLQGLSFISSMGAGRLAELEGQVAADARGLEAEQREADRKERLADAISSQVAASGASGISSFEGSPLTMIKASQEKEATATERDLFNTRIAKMSEIYQGKARKRNIMSQAYMDLYGSAEDAMKSMGGIK